MSVQVLIICGLLLGIGVPVALAVAVRTHTAIVGGADADGVVHLPRPARKVLGYPVANLLRWFDLSELSRAESSPAAAEPVRSVVGIRSARSVRRTR